VITVSATAYDAYAVETDLPQNDGWVFRDLSTVRPAAGTAEDVTTRCVRWCWTWGRWLTTSKL